MNDVNKTHAEGMYKNEKENDSMDNSRTNIDDFLTVRGFGGYGGGYGGGGHGSFSGPTANAIRTDNVGVTVSREADCTRDLNKEVAERFNNSTETLIRNIQFQNQNDAITTLGRDLKNSQIEALNAAHANSVESLKCCCEGRVERAENKAEILAGQKDIIIEGLRRDLASATDSNNISATVGSINANANVNTAAIIQAIGNINGGHGGH
jgi:hypothetical protein